MHSGKTCFVLYNCYIVIFFIILGESETTTSASAITTTTAMITTPSTTALSTVVINKVDEITSTATAEIIPQEWFLVKKSGLEIEEVLFDVVAKSKMHCVFVCKSYQGCRVASYDTVSGSCVGKAEEMDGNSETTPTLFIVN